MAWKGISGGWLHDLMYGKDSWAKEWIPEPGPGIELPNKTEERAEKVYR